MKLKKAIEKYGALALSALMVIMVASVVVADSGTVIQNAEVVNIGGSAPTTLGSASPIDSFTNLTDLRVENDLRVDGDFDSNATTTRQELILGSRFSKALTFTAGATTTPGSLFSLQNTGQPRICEAPVIFINTADTGAMEFNMSTSTSATAFSGSGGSLMATSTNPSSSIKLLSARGNLTGIHIGAPGTYYTTGHGLATSTVWVWNNAEYLLGAFDASGKPDNTKSTDYTGMTGRVYVDCYAIQ